MQVGIVAQRGNPQAAALATEVRAALAAEDVSVLLDEATAAHVRDETDGEVTAAPVEAMTDCALVVSIGGDGTFLYAARGVGATPVVGVNLGEVGFLNAVSPSEAVAAVLGEVAELREGGDLETRPIPRVAAGGEGLTVTPAINEVAILGAHRGHGGGLDLTVRVDGHRYASGHADGVLVATPTGSTAYNLSEGGPLVHPAVDALVCTVMAGADGRPPLVVEGDAEIEVDVRDAPRAVVVSDGRVEGELAPPATVGVRRATESVQVAGPGVEFFAGLGKLE
ncbi:MAG: NAD(+)/NADH kinase [Haloarculaceae archaeon]